MPLMTKCVVCSANTTTMYGAKTGNRCKVCFNENKQPAITPMVAAATRREPPKPKSKTMPLNAHEKEAVSRKAQDEIIAGMEDLEAVAKLPVDAPFKDERDRQVPPTASDIEDAGFSVPKPVSGLASKVTLPKPSTGDDATHVIVTARAGTGKTTTLVGALQVLMGQKPTTVAHGPGGTKSIIEITPSTQQLAVWEAVALSRGKAKSVCFVAFNKSIATELQTRVPQGCDAMTMHSMGFRAVQNSFGRGIKVNEYRVKDIISMVTGQDGRELRAKKPALLNGVASLVGLCKMNLIGTEAVAGTDLTEELSQLTAHYDIDLEGTSQAEVFELVPRVLEQCRNVRVDNCIDYDDMIWLPVALSLPVRKYDLLLVDEAQDLNRCQQSLAKMAGSRLILCGDPRQAIYGFAGADADSMPRMARELGETMRGVCKLPLTVTRRCGKAIVKEANRLVPDFDAHETNGEGSVKTMSFDTKAADNYRKLAGDGDMVLSRVNAPLVSECFRFIRQGRKANIQGRDVGQGLITLITKMKVEAVTDLVAKLEDWLDAETKKEKAKKNPVESRLIALQDKYDCVVCFTEGCNTVSEVVRKIETVFTDDKNAPGIRLSSIHKAKGLEAGRVFFIRTKDAPCPHPMATTAWQREQENNLVYVAVTRAIKELVFVA